MFLDLFYIFITVISLVIWTKPAFYIKNEFLLHPMVLVQKNDSQDSYNSVTKWK
jgi:hypothetical protein